MKMEFDITKITEKIAMQAKENQEEFIIETIRPYCEDILQVKINKSELKQILLKGVQKQEPCEDCISRQAVLEAIGLSEKSRKYGGDHSGYDTLMKYEIQYILEDLPSVTLQPKTGKWIYTGDYITDGMLKCSSCGYEHDVADRFLYCPNCGAKM